MKTIKVPEELFQRDGDGRTRESHLRAELTALLDRYEVPKGTARGGLLLGYAVGTLCADDWTREMVTKATKEVLDVIGELAPHRPGVVQ